MLRFSYLFSFLLTAGCQGDVIKAVCPASRALESLQTVQGQQLLKCQQRVESTGVGYLRLSYFTLFSLLFKRNKKCFVLQLQSTATAPSAFVGSGRVLFAPTRAALCNSTE